MPEEPMIDDPKLIEFEAERKWSDGMKQLEAEIKRFEELGSAFKERNATETDLYHLRLWLKGMFS